MVMSSNRTPSVLCPPQLCTEHTDRGLQFTVTGNIQLYARWTAHTVLAASFFAVIHSQENIFLDPFSCCKPVLGEWNSVLPLVPQKLRVL